MADLGLKEGERPANIPPVRLPGTQESHAKLRFYLGKVKHGMQEQEKLHPTQPSTTNLEGLVLDSRLRLRI